MNEQVMTQTHSQQHIQEERAGKSGSSMQNSLRRSYPASLFLRPGFLPKQKACPSLCISLPS